MGPRLGCFAAVLLGSAVAAASPSAPIGSYAQLEPLGWTADGASFAFRAREDSVADGIPDEESESYTASEGVVVDAATGRLTSYLLALTGEAHADTLRRLGSPRAKELEQWLGSHKLQLPKGRRDASIAMSRDGTLPLLAGGWGAERWEFVEKNPDEIGGGGRIAIAVGKRVVLRFTAESGAGHCGGSVTPFWSPDGRRVAWWIHHDKEMTESPAFDELWITSARGPRVDVKPDKALTPAALDAALRALDQAGFAPVAAAEASEHRAATVVYAAPGFEADARRAATALGGTVEKLTWKPDADLVIALGAPAAR